MFAASIRNFASEIHNYVGHAVVAVLYDFEKFFDSIRIDVLAAALKEMEFPMVDAVMALQQHLAPRIVQLQGLNSSSIVVDKSILAGCGLSIPFVYAYLHKGSKHLQEEHASAHHRTYVDDCVHIAFNADQDMVQDILVRAALALRRSFVFQCKLKMSSQSSVVSNFPKLAKRVQNELSDHGITVSSSDASRDLGVLFNASLSRNRSIANQRKANATKRSTRVVKLAKQTRFARKLFVSGVYSQYTWGHQLIGMAPSEVLRLERMAANASGNLHAQRCLVSTLAFTYGKRAGPFMRIIHETSVCTFRSCMSPLPMLQGI